MKQNLLKTIAIGLMAMVGVNAWADGVNLLGKSTITVTKGSDNLSFTQDAGTKAITMTPGRNTDYKIALSVSDVNLDASQVFVVVEATANGLNTGTAKVRNITLDDTKYDYGSANTNPTNKGEVKMDAGGSIKHMLLFLNPIMADYKNGDNKIVSAFANNSTLALSNVEFNLKTPDTTVGEGEITIYSIGFYNLAEIIAKYPYADNKWQLVNGSNQLRLENAGDANKVKVKDNSSLSLTYEEGKVLFKSLGNLPAAYTTVDLRGLAISDGVYVGGEAMSNLTNPTKILLSTTAYAYFPTMNNNVYILGNRYFAYKDGTAPATTHNSGDGNKDGTSGRYFSFSRNYKAGYNSCILPFQLDLSILPTDLSVYTFTSNISGTLTFTKVTSGTINCNTPFIVKAETAGVYMFSLTHGSEGWNEGKESGYEKFWASATSDGITFVGSYENKVPDGTYADGANSTNYGITSDGTKVAKMKATGASTDTKTTYYRAFISDKRTNAPALSLSFNDLENGTTDIVSLKDVHGLEIISDSAVYNLQGVRMNGDNLPKGIYVKNGKKFVVK